MVRRPGDKTPAPPGGRVAERLRLFMESRGTATAKGTNKMKSKAADAALKSDRRGADAQQGRSKTRTPKK